MYWLAGVAVLGIGIYTYVWEMHYAPLLPDGVYTIGEFCLSLILKFEIFSHVRNNVDRNSSSCLRYCRMCRRYKTQ